MLRFSRGGRPPKTGGAARPVSDQVVTLKQTQSSQWQKLAKIPNDEELLRAFCVDGVKPTAAGLIRTRFQGHMQTAPG